MENAQNSAMSFDGFSINRSLIKINGEIGQDMHIEFDPSGEINKVDQVFRLFLNVRITEKQEGVLIEVDASANFNIHKGDISDPGFENYLFLNAPAILFPYIRAYITSLTALSGISPIILPTVNLTGLKDHLKQNTKTI